MTHFFGVIRGIEDQYEIFKKWVQTRQFLWTVKVPYKDAEGKTVYKDEQRFVQGIYREIRLFEYVVPEECENQAISMFGWENGNIGYWGKGWAKYALAPLRKLLGAKPIPNVPKVPCPFVYRQGVGIECIGMKKDVKSQIKWVDKEVVEKAERDNEKKLMPEGTIKEDL